MYKAILFDLDNTLLDYTRSERDSMRRTLADYGLFEDDEERREFFWAAYLDVNFNHWLNFVNRRGPHRTINEVLVQSFRDALPATSASASHEALAASYWSYFCHMCCFEEGAEALLETVRSRYRLGIVSNGIGEAQRKRLATGGVTELFHSIVVSDEVGIRKPDRAIFDHALLELGLAREEVLFVGDSLADDAQGARNAGLDFVFYNRSRAAIPEGHPYKHAVNSLTELRDLLS